MDALSTLQNLGLINLRKNGPEEFVCLVHSSIAKLVRRFWAESDAELMECLEFYAGRRNLIRRNLSVLNYLVETVMFGNKHDMMPILLLLCFHALVDGTRTEDTDGQNSLHELLDHVINFGKSVTKSEEHAVVLKILSYIRYNGYVPGRQSELDGFSGEILQISGESPWGVIGWLLFLHIGRDRRESLRWIVRTPSKIL